MEISSTNPNLQYVSIFSKDDGRRETSYVVGIHADTLEELLAKAKADYPDAYIIEQDAETWQKTVDGDLRCADGKTLTEPPAPTEEELAEQALAALDAEYEALIDAKKSEIIEASVVYQDEETVAELTEELNAIYEEYDAKREAM